MIYQYTIYKYIQMCSRKELKMSTDTTAGRDRSNFLFHLVNPNLNAILATLSTTHHLLYTSSKQSLKYLYDAAAVVEKRSGRGSAVIGPRVKFLLIYVYMYVCISVCIYPSIHLSICPSIHLSIYLSINLSIYLSMYVWMDGWMDV